MTRSAGNAARGSELDLLRYISAESSSGRSSVAEVFETVCRKFLSLFDISRAGAYLLVAPEELKPFLSERQAISLPICIDRVLNAIPRIPSAPLFASFEFGGDRVYSLTLPIAFGTQTCCVLCLQKEVRKQESAYLAEPHFQSFCALLSTQLSMLLERRTEAHSQRAKSEILRNFLEHEPLFSEAWHTTDAIIPRFLPTWEPAKLDSPPLAQLLIFDPENQILNVSGAGNFASGLATTIFGIEDTTPGMLIEENLRGDEAEYLLLNPNSFEGRYRSYLFEDIPSSELLILVKYNGKIAGVINLEHPRKNAFSTLDISILLDAAKFIAPFAHAISQEKDRQWKREISFLYAQSNRLDRLISVYRHKTSQLIPMIRFSLKELELNSSDADKESLEIMERAVLQLVDYTRNLPSDISISTSFQPVDIADAIRRATDETTFLRSISIDVKIQNRPRPNIVLASGLLQEHIYNLLQNAFYATSSAISTGRITTGHITITVDRLQATDTRGTLTSGPARILLRMSDNGTGIPSGFEERIFEYGFTTKSARGGTGYGLSAARDYARSLGGDLFLESNSSSGASFIMILQEYTPKYHDKLLQRLAPATRE
jgi:signal transduction histidine kinase